MAIETAPAPEQLDLAAEFWSTANQLVRATREEGSCRSVTTPFDADDSNYHLVQAAVGECHERFQGQGYQAKTTIEVPHAEDADSSDLLPPYRFELTIEW